MEGFLKRLFTLILLLGVSLSNYSNNVKTYFVLSNECKKLPSSQLLGINSLEESLAIIHDNKYSCDVKLILADGYHYLNKTLELNSVKNKITIEAFNEGKAIVTGNIPIKKEIIQFESDNIISFPIAKENYIMNVDGRYVTMSYSVDKTNPSAMKQFSEFKQENNPNTYSAIFEDDEIQKMGIGSYIFIHCKWILYKLKIHDINFEQKRVIMNGMKVNVSYIKNNDQVYYSIYNSRKILKPSTFSFIKNKIYYKLDEKENIKNIQIRIPILSKLISISNCKNEITLKGILVEGATMDNIQLAETQGGANFPSAIEIQNSQKVCIENCEFANNMGYSVKISKNSSNCTIKNNYFHDLQGGGILIGDYKTNDSTNNILIDNNLIKSFGRINATCEGILVSKANHVTITNNTICDGYYTGISLGWTWGYGKSYSYGNYVANNHIHHLMQCVLSDGAGIYTLGNQKGTIIENNYIHDIVSRVFSAAGSSLLYFDEGTSNVVARNNVCFGSHTGFHEHYGKCNVVEGNVFAYTNQIAARLSNYQKDSLLTVKNNMFILDCGQTFNKNLTTYGKTENNRFWSGEIVDASNGLKSIDNEIDVKMNVNNLYSQKAINKKFHYGVSTKKMKRKAKLSENFLNEHNQKICSLFPTYSHYFKKQY